MTLTEIINFLDAHIVDHPTPENITQQRYYLNLLRQWQEDMIYGSSDI